MLCQIWHWLTCFCCCCCAIFSFLLLELSYFLLHFLCISNFISCPLCHACFMRPSAVYMRRHSHSWRSSASSFVLALVYTNVAHIVKIQIECANVVQELARFLPFAEVFGAGVISLKIYKRSWIIMRNTGKTGSIEGTKFGFKATSMMWRLCRLARRVCRPVLLAA